MTDDMRPLDPDRMVVLSLKPRFAEAILAGVKTVELRRTVPKIEVPTRALLYATTPVRALLGTCVITNVRSADLALLWREYGSRSDLRYHEFQQYFVGAKCGYRSGVDPASSAQPTDPSPGPAGQAERLPPSSELLLRRHRDRRRTHTTGRLAASTPRSSVLPSTGRPGTQDGRSAGTGWLAEPGLLALR